MVEQTSPKDDVAEALEDLDLAHGLIQEAKGIHDPNGGGYATDHLDAAENCLDRVATALQTLTDKVERYEETLREIASNTWSDWTVPRDKARATLTKDGM